MTDSRDHALRNLGDRMDNAQIGATARFWSLCEKQERGEHPSAEYSVLVGLVGRRFTRLMFGVVLQELTRRPGLFTQAIAALANGIVREVGEALQAFPFAERVNAFNGLARQLSEGLQIGFAEQVDLPTPPAAVAMADYEQLEKFALEGAMALRVRGADYEAGLIDAGVRALRMAQGAEQRTPEPPGPA